MYIIYGLSSCVKVNKSDWGYIVFKSKTLDIHTCYYYYVLCFLTFFLKMQMRDVYFLLCLTRFLGLWLLAMLTPLRTRREADESCALSVSHHIAVAVGGEHFESANDCAARRGPSQVPTHTGVRGSPLFRFNQAPVPYRRRGPGSRRARDLTGRIN